MIIGEVGETIHCFWCTASKVSEETRAVLKVYQAAHPSAGIKDWKIMQASAPTVTVALHIFWDDREWVKDEAQS